MSKNTAAAPLRDFTPDPVLMDAAASDPTSAKAERLVKTTYKAAQAARNKADRAAKAAQVAAAKAAVAAQAAEIANDIYTKAVVEADLAYFAVYQAAARSKGAK